MPRPLFARSAFVRTLHVARATGKAPTVVTASSESKEGANMSQASRPLRFIDIGANLLDRMYQGEYHGTEYHKPDLERVLERAWAAGVEKIIITAGSLQESRDALKLAATDRRLFSTVGVHPTRCGEFEAHEEGPEDYLEQLRQVLKEGQASGKVVAVGECGLDYDRLQFCPAEVQKKYFRAQFALAKESGLPMFLHLRAAADDMKTILAEHLSTFKGGVVHSFDGSAKDAEDLLKLHERIYFGINGCSLKTELNCNIMAALPLPRLMLETDAPWCEIRPSHASSADVKTKLPAVDKKKHDEASLVKGRNEPCNIVQVFEVVAARRELSNKWALAETIVHNTNQLFFPAKPAA